MQYIEAIDRDKPLYTSLFLAGGITSCIDWQSELVKALETLEALKGVTLSVFNPRRKDFPILDPNAVREQIEWEFCRLRMADVVSFWFCEESLCPIALFECASALERRSHARTIDTSIHQRLVIGVHANYKRKQDVEIQTELLTPHQKVNVGWASFIDELLLCMWETAVFSGGKPKTL